jgi:hypothetical protein
MLTRTYSAEPAFSGSERGGFLNRHPCYSLPRCLVIASIARASGAAEPLTPRRPYPWTKRIIPSPHHTRWVQHAANETITMIPERELLRIEVRGELAAILRMAQGAEQARNAGPDADALALQIKMVAGAGFEPAAFRL